MEENKKDRKVMLFISALVIIILALASYIIFDKVVYSEIEKNMTTTTTTSTTTSTSASITTTTTTKKKETNKDDNSNNKKVVLDYEKEKKNNFMNTGYELMSKYTKDKYVIDMTIENINVNGKKHSVTIKNFDPNNYNCKKGKDKVVYFDDKVIYEPVAEGCYITGLSEVVAFNNKYIILRFLAERGGWINIFDANGKEIKPKEDISFEKIISVDKDVIKFMSYEFDEEGSMCRPNEYEMTIENDVVKYKLIKTGEYDYCM